MAKQLANTDPARVKLAEEIKNMERAHARTITELKEANRSVEHYRGLKKRQRETIEGLREALDALGGPVEGEES